MANYLTIFALVLCAGSCFGQLSNQQILNDIARDAYLYFYPLISVETTRYQPLLAGRKMDTFYHTREFPNATLGWVVRPNFDTLYSTAFLDLTQGAVQLSLPDSKGRYYLAHIMDMWSDTIGAPGWRTTGTKKGEYAIIPQGCLGILPPGVEPIYISTPYAWILGRTLAEGVHDFDDVVAFQDKMKITPMWTYACPQVDVPDVPNSVKKVNWRQIRPIDIVHSMTTEQFFEFASHLLNINKPHITDWSFIQVLEKIGIVYGKQFVFAKQKPEVQAALTASFSAAMATIQAVATPKALTNGWNMNLNIAGTYGNDYYSRAYTALAVLGANQPQDAIYPILIRDAQGAQPVGGKCYTLTFKAGGTPPAQAFWSITMYDANGFGVPNAINRFAIHNWDTNYGMKYGADGSLTIYVQPNAPAEALKGNWLPSPQAGTLGITLRVYAPYGNFATYQPPPLVPSAACA